MCTKCDERLDWVSKHFDKAMDEYMEDRSTGNCADTPAKRVRDLAVTFMESPNGGPYAIWYAALAMERLAVMKEMGIPT